VLVVHAPSRAVRERVLLLDAPNLPRVLRVRAEVTCLDYRWMGDRWVECQRALLAAAQQAGWACQHVAEPPLGDPVPFPRAAQCRV
jgi:hypothetical protein